MKLILLAQAAVTLFMTGVIWFVQVVHHPLMSRVGISGFAAYESNHSYRTTCVVTPPMLAELVIAFLLLLRKPAQVTPSATTLGAALVVVIWLTTFLLQVPCHNVLDRGFDSRVHQRLVATNWIRTICWSLRSLLVLWMLR